MLLLSIGSSHLNCSQASAIHFFRTHCQFHPLHLRYARTICCFYWLRKNFLRRAHYQIDGQLFEVSTGQTLQILHIGLPCAAGEIPIGYHVRHVLPLPGCTVKVLCELQHVATTSYRGYWCDDISVKAEASSSSGMVQLLLQNIKIKAHYPESAKRSKSLKSSLKMRGAQWPYEEGSRRWSRRCE